MLGAKSNTGPGLLRLVRLPDRDALKRTHNIELRHSLLGDWRSMLCRYKRNRREGREWESEGTGHAGAGLRHEMQPDWRSMLRRYRRESARGTGALRDSGGQIG